MKRKLWTSFGIIVVVSIVLLFSLSGAIFGSFKYDSDDWKILAKTNTSDGGFCFVRQRFSSFLFGDVKFGYVSSSRSKYAFPLEIDGFHWGGVRFVEKDGNVHLWRGSWEVAVFNPSCGYFTNLVINHTFNETNFLDVGSGSSFFEFEPSTNGLNMN